LPGIQTLASANYFLKTNPAPPLKKKEEEKKEKKKKVDGGDPLTNEGVCF
jgi:hypothetical protein